MNKLYKRNFLRLLDFTSEEINYLVNLSAFLKCQKKNLREKQYLLGKNIALIFENESSRTRCAFEVAAFNQGANVTYMGPGTTHIGSKESIEDSAKIISQFYDGVQYRGYSHEVIKKFAKYSSIPVWNGLTDTFHPTQILADLLTIKETMVQKKEFYEIKLAYVGDVSNNIGNSILEVSSLLGIDLRLVAPEKYWPNSDFLEQCKLQLKKSGGKILCTENIETGVNNVDFIYTDVWISIGESKSNWDQKIKDLKNYQVNSHMLLLTNNKNVKVLHCLPALHDSNTIISNSLCKKYDLNNGLEITDDIFRLFHSTIFNQSQNRLHTIKSLMIATLCKQLIRI